MLGMILGRQDMSSPVMRLRVFAWGAGVAIAAEFVSWLLVRTLSAEINTSDREVITAIFGTGPMPPMPLYMIAGAGTACAVIAVSITLGELYADSISISLARAEKQTG